MDARKKIDLLSTHGGDVYALARRLQRRAESITDHSSNTHAFALDITAELIRQTPYAFEHYPDSLNRDLCERIAVHEGVEPPHVLAGNGSAELIWLSLQALAPRQVLLVGPMFSEYARVCEVLGIPYECLTPPAGQDFICGAAELKKLWDSPADLAVLCSPNNPGAVTYPNIHDMLSMLRVPRVLIDNTYKEFLWGEPEYSENAWRVYSQWVRPGVSLFSMNSFTKFFACPGIRLGYIVGEPTQLRYAAQLQPPWSVSCFAQTMGQKFLESIDRYRERLPALRQARTSFAMQLRRLACIDPDQVFEGPSFITVRLRGVGAATAKDALVRRDILVRNCDSIPGMPPGYLRFQVRGPAENEALISVLDWHGERGW